MRVMSYYGMTTCSRDSIEVARNGLYHALVVPYSYLFADLK